MLLGFCYDATWGQSLGNAGQAFGVKAVICTFPCPAAVGLATNSKSATARRESQTACEAPSAKRQAPDSPWPESCHP